MPAFNRLRDWKSVFPLADAPAHLQEPVDALRALSTILGGGGTSAFQTGNGTVISFNIPQDIVGWFVGITTASGPNGQDDWTDARVWVQPGMVNLQSSSTVGPNAPIYIAPDPPPLNTDGSYSAPYPVCATSLADLPAAGTTGLGSHNIPAGTYVLVMALLDQQNPPQIHYLIPGGGGGGSIPTGQFTYQLYETVAPNQNGFRLDRACPIIPNA